MPIPASAAVALLRHFADRLERGEVEVVDLTASDDVIGVKVALPAPAPAPAIALAALQPGDPCPRCRQRSLVDAAGTLMCMTCGSPPT